MNLRSIVNNVTSSTVNENSYIEILRSIGYTSGPGRKQVPQYDYPISGYAQVQALDNADLQKIQGLNLQGVIRSVYLTGSLHGVVRKTGEGGDLIKYNGQTWLISTILETWSTWTKAVITLQIDA